MTQADRRIVGNYALGALLGRGGTSEVYAAEHRFLGDRVAIKLVRPELAMDDGVAEAFVAEAARTREIVHPNVVRVIDFGHDDACYLVMDRLSGESLAMRLRRGPLAEPELRELAAAIADGLAAAHARGIVHRDLKPGNVMLCERPTIIDFGIAKSLGDHSAVVTSRRIGTLAYMAPEQLADGLITPAVDMWALGVVMFEAATGRRPFEGFAEGRCPQLVEPAPRASTFAPVSPALDSLIARCLERDPSKRPAAMTEVARMLRHAESDERITEDAGPIASTAAPRKPRRAMWIVAALCVLAAAGVAIAVGTRDEDRPAPGAPAPVIPVVPAPEPPPAAPAVTPPAAPEVTPPAATEVPPPAATEATPPAATEVRRKTTPPKRQPPRRTPKRETLD